MMNFDDFSMHFGIFFGFFGRVRSTSGARLTDREQENLCFFSLSFSKVLYFFVSAMKTVIFAFPVCQCG